MNRTHTTVSLALWAALVLNGPGPVAAAGSTQRDLGAHEHGHGVLEVVADGDELVIALRIPAVNAVGFEHAPSTEQQHRRVEETIARFRLGERLFVTTRAAGCRLEDAHVELAGISEEHDEDHGDEEHEKGGHEEHAHGSHASDEHAEEGHSELLAEYHFRCADAGRLEAIEVRVFDALDDVEELHARVVNGTFQGAAELTGGNTRLKLVR